MTSDLKRKRVLIIGVTGQVGNALVEELATKFDLVTAARKGADVALDLTDSDQIIPVLKSVKPDLVINAAAYTQVDQAEDEPDIAYLINTKAPGEMAEYCKRYGAWLIHYSTDYVFSGSGNLPLKEDLPVEPVNVYGKTKLGGEEIIQKINCDHLIFRTCWVYDAHGKNFVNTIAQLAQNKSELKVIDDQFGTPTSAALIASVTSMIIDYCYSKTAIHKKVGNRVYNLTALGFTNWFDFASSIVNKISQYVPVTANKLTPVATSQYPTKARRPKWSVLNTGKLMNDFEVGLPPWEQLLSDCLNQKYLANDENIE